MSNKGAWRLAVMAESVAKMAVKLLDVEFEKVNPNQKRVKSPAEQFDESHKKWLEGGREC